MNAKRTDRKEAAGNRDAEAAVAITGEDRPGHDHMLQGLGRHGKRFAAQIRFFARRT